MRRRESRHITCTGVERIVRSNMASHGSLGAIGVGVRPPTLPPTVVLWFFPGHMSIVLFDLRLLGRSSGCRRVEHFSQSLLAMGFGILFRFAGFRDVLAFYIYRRLGRLFIAILSVGISRE